MSDRPRWSRRELLRITAVVGVGGLAGGKVLAELVRRGRLHRVAESRTRMGTVVTLTAIHPDPTGARHVVDESFAELDRLEAILSRHRPDSQLSRLNAVGRLPGAAPDLLSVLEAAGRVSAATEGAFDVTVLPLLDLYTRSFESRGVAPRARDVSTALERVDFRGVHVAGDEVVLASPDMAITLDGIAKGYIVDATLARMHGLGAERVLVNAGGDMASSVGPQGGEPWRISVQDPHDEADIVALLALDGQSVATSGDYMHAFTLDRRFHHILDPRTGYSPPEASSATVIAAHAADADALSTAALVLGPARAVELYEPLDGVEAVLVDKAGRRSSTSGASRLSLI